MDESILKTIKKLLGLAPEYTPFDTDIIVLINAALMTLCQIGVGPKEGFFISDMTSRWSDFLTNETKLNGAQQYIYIKVRMVFDPPGNSFVMSALESQAKELEWRLNVQAESVEKFDFVDMDNNPRLQ